MIRRPWCGASNNRLIAIFEKIVLLNKIRELRRILFLLFVALSIKQFAQTIVISGKITDAATGEGVGYAAVFVKGANVGVTADFDGNYKITINIPSDSLWCSYLGYHTKSKAISRLTYQTVNFALESNNFDLTEVEIKPKENPAITLIREANRRQRDYNPDNIDAYKYESFSKLELSVDHLDERLQKMPWFKNIKPLFDSINGIRSDEGKPLLPVFISETVSDYYWQSPPRKHHEYIKASKVNGIGVTDGTTTVQVLGATLQQYNFYDSWITIMKKTFISPIGDGCFYYYKYRIRDTVTIENKTCYKIELTPKRKEDLAFTGNIWISDTSFAIMRISVTIARDANLNFVNQIKISQEMTEVAPGTYLPLNTRILIDLAELVKTTPSFLAKFIVSNKDFEVHNKFDASVFEHVVDVAKDAMANKNDTAYWQEHRHEALDTNEMRSYEMVDSLRNIKSIKNGTALSKFLGTGYHPIGKIDIGPYYYLLNKNYVQGWRVAMGLRTNYKFSHVTTTKAYAAYGFKDQNIRYSVLQDFVISRKKWTNAGLQRRVDLDQAGISDGSTEYNSAVFALTSIFSTLSRINLTEDNRIYFLRQFHKDWIIKLNGSNRFYKPYFDFGYLDEDGKLETTFTTTSANIELRFAHNERVLVDDNVRYLLGTERSPVVTMGYTHAFKDVLGGSFNYDKFYLNIRQSVKTGIMGHAFYYIKGAKYFGVVPFPALDIHPGNQTFYFSTTSFNLMNFYEFVSDQYISAFYEQYMEGLITNRIPLLKKLHWRTLATAKAVYGSMSDQNRKIIPLQYQTFRTLERIPYMEVSYGFENMFRYFRVDVVHRLSYRYEGARKWGVLVSAQFNL
jgi:hypothetical protein